MPTPLCTRCTQRAWSPCPIFILSDYIVLGGATKAKEMGKMCTEGKEYVAQK
ncbi:hypothetical protein [Wielerella bovis]|uniref:hypothetical protein n=1 Tax=Wielerella bovis TaxID=2917790 RepID=UPI003D287275